MENKAKEAKIKKAREIIAIIQMILFSVATIIIIVNIITFGLGTTKINTNSVKPYLYEGNGYYVNFGTLDIILSLFLTTLFLMGSILGSIRYYKAIVFDKDHIGKDPIAASYILFLLIPLDYYISIASFKVDAAYMYGRIFGVSLFILIPVLIYNLVEIIIYIVLLIKDRKIQRKEEREKQQIQEAKAKEWAIKQQQKEAELAKKKQLEDDYQNTISQIGKKFFVNYYPKLKNWNEIDIADEIKDMNYESKMARIKNAKKLFANKWDERFTREIANSSTTEIDETTIKMANAIIDVYYKQ